MDLSWCLYDASSNLLLRALLLPFPNPCASPHDRVPLALGRGQVKVSFAVPQPLPSAESKTPPPIIRRTSRAECHRRSFGRHAALMRER